MKKLPNKIETNWKKNLQKIKKKCAIPWNNVFCFVTLLLLFHVSLIYLFTDPA